MASLRSWALALLRGSVPVAIGLLLWVAMESGDEKRQEMLKVRTGPEPAPMGGNGAAPGPEPNPRLPQALPEANPEILAERRQHNRLIMAALREAAETNENVAQRPVPWRK